MRQNNGPNDIAESQGRIIGYNHSQNCEAESSDRAELQNHNHNFRINGWNHEVEMQSESHCKITRQNHRLQLLVRIARQSRRECHGVGSVGQNCRGRSAG
jgi:hypothetical protein